jgi:type VI secretion system protein
MEKLLGRAAEVLEAYSKSYVELRKGYEEFGKEMGVRTVRGDSPVERARDAKQLLAFLLDLRAEGRTSDLQSAFADLMVHQVALLNGVVEGARGILTRLDPNAVAEKSGGGMWPMKAAQQWKTYEESWHEIADEEDSISDALFGTEFARAYSAIVGQRSGDEKGGGGRPTPAPRRSSSR